MTPCCDDPRPHPLDVSWDAGPVSVLVVCVACWTLRMQPVRYVGEAS